MGIGPDGRFGGPFRVGIGFEAFCDFAEDEVIVGDLVGADGVPVDGFRRRCGVFVGLDDLLVVGLGFPELLGHERDASECELQLCLELRTREVALDPESLDGLRGED